MADRRDYDRYRGSSAYRADAYYGRSQNQKRKTSILPYQIGVCGILLLCLLGGWLLNSDWFTTGKQVLLAQLNAADKTQQVENILSGLWGQQKKEEVDNAVSDISQALPEDSESDVSAQKLEELYRYIEQYGGGEEKETEDSVQPTGMGGYLPVAVPATDTGRYPAPEGCLLSPVAVSAKPLLPLKKGTVTSIFGYRLHPITDELDFHTGLDLAAAKGTRISAAWPGTVEETGWSDIYGNYALVSHGGGLATFYAHCDSVVVKEGMRLRQGELIGYVGETGWATGSHLHWEIRVNGLRVDPAWIFGTRQVSQEDTRA